MKNRKHIFLDIDGVLATSAQFWSKRRHEDYDCYRFDSKCVRVFNDIIEKTNPIIVLSSDWRDHYELEVMNNIMEWNGVNATVSKYTSGLWGVKYFNLQELEKCRAAEILMYVEDNDIKKWVAIDDLDLSEDISDENFVRTPRINEGIKQSGVKEKIIKRLL